jgi:hypothetical protein
LSRLSPPPSNRPGDPPARTEERSQVRPREDGSLPVPAEQGGGQVQTRRERIEELVRRAHAVLGRLPASDPRATLLGLAVQRRDLVLIEAVLADLGEQ